MRKKSLADLFAIGIGLFLFIQGIWEIFSPVVFGVLTGNALHAFIHLFLGLIGVLLGWAARARGFCIFLGVLLLVVGGLWYVSGPKEIIVGLLNVNQAVALLNLAIGAVALVLGLSTKPRH